ncbi:MAG: hypothetical protein LUC87_08165 [Clostridiales bacterium]|nr:hypothetical protein [Clostridiales bacterium]MCD8368104.1 hypothetical protein [Clostridiales bacterium]
MKKKSYRERYFEDNQPVREVANNRKGYRIVYRYVGLWVAWRSEKWPLKTVKWAFALAELASICLYLTCARVDTPLNRCQLANGFGVLSVVPWILELSGVVRFLLSKAYAKEMDSAEIDQSIRYGAVLRAVLLGLSLLCSVVNVLIHGTATVLDAGMALGILASIALSAAVWRGYRSLLLDTYHNVDGAPGSRC